MAAQLRHAASAVETKWCKEAVKDLLSDTDAAGAPVDVPFASILKASEILDSYYDQMWMTIRIRRRNLFNMFVALTAIVLLILAMAWQSMLGGEFNSGSRLLAICAYGALGASLSTVYSLARLDPAARAPERLKSSIIVLMRPLIGAAAALATYAFLLAGLGPETIKAASSVPAGIYVAAFVSGFSEKLIFKLAEKVSGKTDD